MGRIDALVTEVELLSSELTHLTSLLALHSASTYRRLSTGVHIIDDGDTGYMIACTALVLMMTIPGLGLYYSGMVRIQNVLVTVMQSFSIACTITLVWLMWGYSLAQSPAGVPQTDGAIRHSSAFIGKRFAVGEIDFTNSGDANRLWLWGLNVSTVHQSAPTIPESVYCMYQLAFAIITAALICGSFADRSFAIPPSRMTLRAGCGSDPCWSSWFCGTLSYTAPSLTGTGIPTGSSINWAV